MHSFINNKYMDIEHQLSFFHIYHNRRKIFAATFQCKLLLGVYDYHHLCKKDLIAVWRKNENKG